MWQTNKVNRLSRALLSCLVLGPVLTVGCASRPATETIWIGHLAPLSGLDKSRGEQARQAIELTLSAELDSDKKAAGRSIAVIHVDSRNDEETVRAEAVRLITVNRVAALIGSLDAALADRLVREGQAYGVPVVVSSEMAPSLREEGAVALGVSAAWRGEQLAKLALEQKLTKLAVLIDSRSFLADELAAAFTREARKKDATLRERTFDSTSDKIDWVEEVLQDGPSAVLVAASPRVFSQIEAALRKREFKRTLIYGGEDFGPGAVQPNGATEVLLATACCTPGLTIKGQEWAHKFEESFREAPLYSAFQAHDGLRLVLEGLQEASPARSLTLRQALLKLETFESLMGAVIFKDRRTRRPLFLLQRNGNSTRLLKTVPPQTD